MSHLQKDLFPFITRQEIEKLVRFVARQIETDFEGQEVVLVCPLKGSILFLADLCRELRLSQEVEFVHVAPRTKGGAITIFKDVGIDLKDRHVLIIEEIIDTGRTLNYLYNHLLAADPASLRIVTLLDKPARRELPLEPDYIGRTIDDRYVIGYGMDSNENGRNYPDIYSLKN